MTRMKSRKPKRPLFSQAAVDTLAQERDAAWAARDEALVKAAQAEQLYSDLAEMRKALAEMNEAVQEMLHKEKSLKVGTALVLACIQAQWILGRLKASPVPHTPSASP